MDSVEVPQDQPPYSPYSPSSPPTDNNLQLELERQRSYINQLTSEVTTLKHSVAGISSDVRTILQLLLPTSPVESPTNTPPHRHRLPPSYSQHVSAKPRRDSISSVPGLHSGTSLVGILKQGAGDSGVVGDGSPPTPLSPVTCVPSRVDFADNSPPGLLDTSHCSGGSGGSDSGVFRTSGASSKSDGDSSLDPCTILENVPDTYMMDHEGEETEALLGGGNNNIGTISTGNIRRQQIPSDADSGNESPRAWLCRLSDNKRQPVGHPSTQMTPLNDCTSSRSTLESLLGDNDGTNIDNNSLSGTGNTFLCTDL